MILADNKVNTEKIRIKRWRRQASINLLAQKILVVYKDIDFQI